jgi:hypothetical protein
VRVVSRFRGPPGRAAAKEETVSYEIDVSSVRAVLLADGWHRVKGGSFGIEPYGYVAGAAPEPKAAEEKGNGKPGKAGKKRAAVLTPPHVADRGLSPTLGARWTKPNGEVIACPVGSVIALRHQRARAAKA